MKEIFVAIGAVSVLAAVFFMAGFSACERMMAKENDSIKCTVHQFVDVDSVGTENFQGVPRPYTVLEYAPKKEVIILPGKIGYKGDVVSVPESLRRNGN